MNLIGLWYCFVDFTIQTMNESIKNRIPKRTYFSFVWKWFIAFIIMQDFIISVFQYIINVILMPILIVAEFFYELIELLTCKKQKNPEYVLITGATSGIGLELAKKYGAMVFVEDLAFRQYLCCFHSNDLCREPSWSCFLEVRRNWRRSRSN